MSIGGVKDMVFQIIADNSKRDLSKSSLAVRLAGEERCVPGHSYGPYIRDYYLVHYCVSGKGILYCRERRFEISAGKIFIICPGEVTTYTADTENPWHYIWIGFDGEDAVRLRRLAPVVKYNYDTFMRVSECVRAGISSPEIYMSQTYELLYNVFSDGAEHSDVRRLVKEYVRLNYMKPITVEEIAENMGLNRRYLSRIFKEKYGVPIKSYIVSVRCRKAGEFLRLGYTVAEAAMMCGYSDAFAFSKIFSKVMGAPPSDFKKTGGSE